MVGQSLSVGFAAVTLASATLVALIARAAVSFKESLQMFADARIEAQTDSLTGLGNRRKLMTDLRRELQLASVASPRVLVLFDLDGFKRYNDTYGHPAGDVLLARLGANLGRAMKPYGGAYRVGGDEFCVLVMTGASSAKTIIALAAAALSEQGEGFAIKASNGAVILPHEARDATLAMKIADQRMYAHKEDRRSSATRQTRDILLQVLQEREPDLGEHLKGVAQLAMGVGTRMSLLSEELDEVVRAAELHDVGKMAIPDEILHKPGPLTDAEWSFVRQHTIIGERILGAAPALLAVAKLVRASHEHWDGSGYPDGLAGEAIPAGARIVAVCDAFDAMTTSRPYRDAMSVEDALAELRACAGTQFDPTVVEAFCEEIASLPHRYGDRTAVVYSSCLGALPHRPEAPVEQLAGLRGGVVGAQQHHAQLHVAAPGGGDHRASGAFRVAGLQTGHAPVALPHQRVVVVEEEAPTLDREFRIARLRRAMRLMRRRCRSARARAARSAAHEWLPLSSRP